MDSLKTMAVVYEASRENEFKNILGKLTFDAYSFVFIRLDPQQEGSYTLSGGGAFSGVLETKLKAVDEIFVVNPKGTIAPYLRSLLSYAEENAIAVNYLYKYCYNDCAFRKGFKCTRQGDAYFVPRHYKLLPACESYTRIYDNVVVPARQSSPPVSADSDKDAADDIEEAVDLTLMFK